MTLLCIRNDSRPQLNSAYFSSFCLYLRFLLSPGALFYQPEIIVRTFNWVETEFGKWKLAVNLRHTQTEANWGKLRLHRAKEDTVFFSLVWRLFGLSNLCVFVSQLNWTTGQFQQKWSIYGGLCERFRWLKTGVHSNAF